MREASEGGTSKEKVPAFFVKSHSNKLKYGRIWNYRLKVIIMRLNKVFYLIAIALMATAQVQAQDLNILVNKKGKVGFADKNGNEVIKCEYESAMPFSNGTAIVTKSGKSGIINEKGEILLPLKYSSITSWTKELYLIKSGKKMGLADHSGKVVLEANYSHISKPNCYGKALIALGGSATANEKKTYMANAKYGIIDLNGNILVTPKYKGLYEFSFDGKNKFPYYEGKRLEYSYHNTVDTLITDCSYLGFSKNGYNIYGAGIMDGNGNELVKQNLYDFVMQPQDGMTRFYILKKKQTICGYHNLNTGESFQTATFNTAINDMNYWSHGDFIGDIAPVNGDTWSFIDKSGKVLRSGFKSLKYSRSTKLWAAQNSSSSTWDVFDDKNNDVITLSNYADINFPVNEKDEEIFSVNKDGKYGCINRIGETIVPFDYEQILSNSYNTLGVKKNGKWGLLSANNDTLIATEYVNVILPSEYNSKHFWVQKSDSLFYHINLNTKELSSTGYKAVTNFSNGIAHVAPTKMIVDNTPVNRAQIFSPNTPKTEIEALDISTCAEMFGYLLNTDDVLLFDFPVSTMYKEKVVKEIRTRGKHALNKAEKKKILLDVTKENRSYELNSVLGEDEWNY